MGYINKEILTYFRIIPIDLSLTFSVYTCVHNLRSIHKFIKVSEFERLEIVLKTFFLKSVVVK